MAIHYEQISAGASVTHAAPLSLIGGDLLSATRHALVLGSDDVVLVVGSLDELRAFHARVGAALDAEAEHVDEDHECDECQAEWDDDGDEDES